MASILRIPAATADSEVILKMPIFPVAGTCMPPHNSTESPNFITRTASPYFSPNKAIAPNFFASSMGTARRSSKGMFE